MRARFPWLCCCRRLGVALMIVAALFVATTCAARPAGLLRPNGIAVAPDGSLYVMDRGHYRVVHLAADGRFLGAFGRLGTGPDDIYAGWDVALDSLGNIYICNIVTREDGSGTAHDGVKVFTPDGHLVQELDSQDYGYDDGVPRNIPYDLAIDDQDRIYVAYFGTNTLRVFNRQGDQVAEFFGGLGSEDEQFSGLFGIDVHSQRDLVYVIDHFSSRIHQFSLAVADTGALTLTQRLTFGTYGRGPGQLAYPQYLVVDEQSGRVYVADMGNQRIQVFNEQGEYVTEFSPLAQSDPATSGLKAWQVMGLALGKDGAIYAADALNNAIWVFEPDGRLRTRLEVRP